MIEPYLGEKVYKKPTANRLSMDAELLRKTSKICNLTITKTILLKITSIMYLYKTFHLAQKLGRNS